MRKLALSAFVLATACGPSGVKVAPVLDTVTAPDTLTLDAAANKYHFTFTVQFHDDDSTVSSIRVELQGYPSQTLNFLDTSLTQTVNIDLGAGFKGKTLSWTIQVIDATGLASNPKFGTVTPQ